ncbi:MAG: hypothetical protein ACI9X4_002252 [Glaciecola sp.]|jgi:hypothetical protein
MAKSLLSFPSGFAWIGLAACLLAACGRSTPALSSTPNAQGLEVHPEPTDPRRLREGDAGGEDHAGRDRYREQMHRAPKGMDWKAIEASHWAQEHRRRLRLAENQKTRLLGSQAALSGATSGLPPTTKTRLDSSAGPLNPSSIAGPGYWEEVGSSNQAGHTRCATLGPEVNGEQTLYVGSAGGGLWSRGASGSPWSPLSDSLFGGVDEVIALTPPIAQDPDVLIIRRGTDLFRSTDAGLTWNLVTPPANLAIVHTVTRLYDGNQTLLMLTRVSTGLGGQKTQLYRSVDLGASFQMLYEAPSFGHGDLWTPQGGPGAGLQVFMALRGKLYRSDDGGQTFPQELDLNPGNPKCHIAGSEQAGPTLYVVLQEGSNWRLYRSDDGGASALTLGTLPDYWGSTRSMVGFSSNAQHVVYGGVNGYHSSNGGLTFQPISSWAEYYGDPANKLHADLRGLDVVREDLGAGVVQDRLYFNTDGGTYESIDYGLTVHNLSLQGMGVGQFYDTHTSSLDPRFIAGGTQDQGYQYGVVQPYFESGPSTPLEQLISGDYGHLVSGNGSHDFLYSTYPGFILIQQGEINPTLSTQSFPLGASNLWLPPLVADPTDSESFYFLADRLWRYQRNGTNWQPFQHSSQDFAAGPGSYLSAMAVAPSDSQRMYAATDSGRLWWSIDGGVLWTEASDTGPAGHFFYGNALIVDPIDPLHAVVSGSGYAGPGVRETFDGGDHWVAMDAGLPATQVYDVAWSPSGNGNVFAATEAGAYRYVRARRLWQNIMDLTAPSTLYWSVETVEASHRVRYGTYGRGIWDFVLTDPVRNLGGRYCDPAIPNSTLLPGQLNAVGKPLASSGSIEFTASLLPPNEMGYVLYSTERDFNSNPVGSDGVLCIGPNFHTFPLQSTGATGVMQETVTLGVLPANAGQSVLAGSTWYFQAWHTDFVQIPSGNYTNAVGIHFH